MIWLLLGCLERTTGEPAELDPRFTAGQSSAPQTVAHDPDAGPAQLFEETHGPVVMVTGTLTSLAQGAVDLDVLRPSPGTEAGVQMVGKLLLPKPDTFELQIPAGEGALILQFFQDTGPRGPDDGDPYAGRQISVLDLDLDLGEIELVVGARSTTPTGALRSHVWPEHPGPWTLLVGELIAERALPVAVDMRRPDPNSQTGDAYVGKEQLSGPGAFTLLVPQGQGTLTLQFFQDAGGDGPSADDPFAQATIEVGSQERISLEVRLEQMGAVAPATTPPGTATLGTPAPPAPGRPAQGTDAPATPAPVGQ